MEAPLKTAQGKSAPNYSVYKVDSLGGWNADASDSNLGEDQFSVMKNWRMAKFGQIETRSGYTELLVNGTKKPLAKGDYRIDDSFADITVFYESGQVRAFVYNYVTGSTWTSNICTTSNEEQECFCLQFENFFIVTVFGIGTYYIQPLDTTLSQWTNGVLLGKQVTPTPNGIDFLSEVTGDLFLYDNFNDHNHMMIRYDLNTGENIKIKLPIDATYYRADNPAFISPGRRWWTYPKNDVIRLSRQLNDRFHRQHRGWGYRLKMRLEYSDVRGQKFRYDGYPSTDFWVPDWHMRPAHLDPAPWLAIDPRNGDNNWLAPSQWLDPFSRPTTGLDMPWKETVNGQTSYNQQGKKVEITGDPFGGESRTVPNDEAFAHLANKYRDYTNDATADPYYFPSWLFGWRNEGGTVSHEGKMPYQTDIAMSELKGYPGTIIKWTDFTTLPANCVQIDVYRTAYTYPDPKDNVDKSPNFAEHRFGYVGTIKPGETWTDEVADDAIVFGDTSDLYEAFLVGEFSGKTMEVFNDSIIIGDIYNTHRVLAPTALIQAFGYSNGQNALQYYYLSSELTDLMPDGKPKYTFAYAYEDENGLVSDPTPITLDLMTGRLHVNFTFPTGYAPDIQTIVLYRSEWETNVRNWYRLTSQPVNKVYYVSINDELIDPAIKISRFIGTAPPAAEVFTTHDPGTIMWSKPHDFYIWPQENERVCNSRAPVTHMNDVLGPLYIFTDEGVSITDLGDRFERDQKRVGCIGRFIGLKKNKVVVHLAADGLFVTEGSGQREVLCTIGSEIIKYLREEIPGKPRLLNARRATAGLLSHKGVEYWLHFPSSIDLYPSGSDTSKALPARTFILKEFGNSGFTSLVAYEFDLAVPVPQSRVIFCSHTSGKLFSAHYDETRNAMVVIDNDTMTPWVGGAYLEKSWALEQPTKKKELRLLVWDGEAKCDLRYVTGNRRKDLVTNDPVHGNIDPACQIFDAAIFAQGEPQTFQMRMLGRPAIEKKGRAPITRIITSPNEKGEHHATITSISIEAAYTGRV